MEMFDAIAKPRSRWLSFIALCSSRGIAAAQTPPASGDAAADAETIESIIVTARRRAESLQDTPVAVTALSAAALERQQIVSTTDLDKVAPNLQFHSYGTLTGNNSAAQVFIRGIGQTRCHAGGRSGRRRVHRRCLHGSRGRRGHGIPRHRQRADPARPARHLVRPQHDRRRRAAHHQRTRHRCRQFRARRARRATTCAKRSVPSTCRWAATGPRAWRSACASATATSRACSTARISATRTCAPGSSPCAGSLPRHSPSRCAATTPRKTRTARRSCSSR